MFPTLLMNQDLISNLATKTPPFVEARAFSPFRGTVVSINNESSETIRWAVEEFRVSDVTYVLSS